MGWLWLWLGGGGRYLNQLYTICLCWPVLSGDFWIHLTKAWYCLLYQLFLLWGVCFHNVLGCIAACYKKTTKKLWFLVSTRVNVIWGDWGRGWHTRHLVQKDSEPLETLWWHKKESYGTWGNINTHLLFQKHSSGCFCITHEESLPCPQLNPLPWHKLADQWMLKTNKHLQVAFVSSSLNCSSCHEQAVAFQNNVLSSGAFKNLSGNFYPSVPLDITDTISLWLTGKLHNLFLKLFLPLLAPRRLMWLGESSKSTSISSIHNWHKLSLKEVGFSKYNNINRMLTIHQ